jgi:hypothetical protein
MKIRSFLVPAGSLLAAFSLPLSATVVEDWQFNDAAGTQFSGLVNAAGNATFTGNMPQVAADGSGNLSFTVGGNATDNVFRNAILTTKDQTTGKFELSFTISAATIAGGDATGANVGFGMRDDSGDDLFLVRLQRQTSVLRLEYRTGASELLENFGVTTVSDLQVRVVADLDTDTCAVYWRLGTGAEKCATNLPMGATGLEFDQVRMAANTNTVDWGPTDRVDVDFLTIATYTDPPALPAIEDWQLDDAAGTSLDLVANAVGNATLGGAAANALTDGLGDLVFTVGGNATANIFRNGDLTTPNQTTGKFEMDWYVSSATILGGNATGANVGFGMRDAGTNTDLFLVRLQRQSSTLRLQHRVGATNTDLVDFGVTSLTDLRVRVVADLDADTFSVFWQLGTGVGRCQAGIPMSAPNLEFDMVRVVATTNTDDWGLTDTVKIKYLTIRGVSVVGDLNIAIANGPAAGQVTLTWPTTTPPTAVLESSLNLVPPWTQITDPPTVNGSNYELVVPIGSDPERFFRLRTP